MKVYSSIWLINKNTVTNQEAEREKEEARRRLTKDIQQAAPEQLEIEDQLLLD